MSSVLQVSNLTKTFKSGLWPFTQIKIYTAVHGISFELQQGEILGLLGLNGAGKTTTIQMLLNTLTPTSGIINYFGIDFKQDPIAALKRIGYASSYDKLPARLTVTQNLDIVGRMYQIDQPERSAQIEKLLRVFGMWDKRDVQTGTLSAGQTTRVILAKAFMGNPDIVLLDEPTASLDPDVAIVVRQFIVDQCRYRKTSALITSHNMDEVTQICDRVLILKSGTIIANDTPKKLAQSISKVRMQLTLTDQIDQALMVLCSLNLSHVVQENQITIEIDEHMIASVLAQLASHSVIYSHISINKPTLEDYFLAVAK